MKIRLPLAITTGVIVPLLSAAPLAALQDASSYYSNSGQAQATAEQVQTTEATTDLQTRLNKRKEALKTKLTTVEQKRISARCQNAQTTVKALQTKVSSIETTRVTAYTTLLQKLNSLKTMFASRGADTTALTTQIGELQTKVDTFKTDMATYKQAVADVAAVDCVNDPTGFKASLEAARSSMATLRQDSAAIRSYLSETVKATITTLRGSETKESNG